MPDLTELKRLAEQGQWMPPDTAKKVIAVALAALDLDESVMSLALFNALEGLKS